MDNIDKVQQNTLMPFEQMKKETKDLINEKGNARPSEVDAVGISQQYWMADFRSMWNTEYPRSAEKWNEDFWASWYKNFSAFTRQDIEYAFNEVRKVKRDMPPNLSHLHDFCANNAQKRIKIADVKSGSKCKDIEAVKCEYGDPYWQLTKYGTHVFQLMCIFRCDKSIDGYPNEFQKKHKPQAQTKGTWFTNVAKLLSNSDAPIFKSGKTQKDRKFETYQYAELFPDGNIKEVLKAHNLDENLSFVEQCQQIAELPKKETILSNV